LKNGEDYSVKFEEVEEIDSYQDQKRPKQGESVFIAPKRKQNLSTSRVAGYNSQGKGSGTVVFHPHAKKANESFL